MSAYSISLYPKIYISTDLRPYLFDKIICLSWMSLLWLIIHYHKKLRIPFRNSLDVTYTLNHYWMKYIILVVNLSFFFFHKRIYMKKNERFSDMALKKEIWFQHYAMVINVHKLLWFFDTWKEICLTISKKKG